MPYYGYMIYEAERTRSPVEQRAADALLGQRAAALAQLLRSLARPARALRRQWHERGRPVSVPASRQRELAARLCETCPPACGPAPLARHRGREGWDLTTL
jgi:hypothetical protein